MGISTHSRGLTSGQTDARTKLGLVLRTARERAGISIDAISQETKISKQFILSLELGKLDALPGQVFGRGFVKNISRFLRSDPGEALRLYDACWGESSSSAMELSSANTTEAKAASSNDGSTNDARTTPIEAQQKTVTQFGNPDSQAKILSSSSVPDVKHLPSVPAAPLSVKIPSWLLRAVMSAHVRLVALATISLLFVLAVFGRWIAGHWHQIRSHNIANVADPAINHDLEIKPSDQMPAADLKSSTVRTDSIVEESFSSPAVDGARLGDAEKLAQPMGIAQPAVDDAPVAVSSSGTAFEQVMEVHVVAPVELKLILDGKKVERSHYEAESYRFSFQDKAELRISDASNVDIIYNGRSLGVLGSKGRKRRILFQARSSDRDFEQ